MDILLKGKKDFMKLLKLVAFSCSILIVLLTLLIKESSAREKKTIGVIIPAGVPYYEKVHGYILKKLEGENIDFLIQRPFPDTIALSNAARKLIAYDVDIILTYGTGATIAALRERPYQPVVYVGVYSPAIEKYRTRTATGVEFRTPVFSIIRYLYSMKELKRIGIVYNPHEIDSLYQVNEFIKCCTHFQISVIRLEIRSPSELKRILSNINVDALIFTTSSIANIALSEIHDFAINNRIPVASLLPRRESRPVISLYPSPKRQAEKAVLILQKILSGRKPEEVQKDLSADMELLFDLGVTQKMNLKIPAELLTEATEVIY